jgi:hypothetical protein
MWVAKEAIESSLMLGFPKDIYTMETVNLKVFKIPRIMLDKSKII